VKRNIFTVSICFLAALIACGDDDGASGTVKSFAAAIADSSYAEAWSLITPESRQWYDSTSVILHEFGWTESREAACRLAGDMTEEEFQNLTGEDLFARMAGSSSDAHNLSTSIKSVSYPDSLVCVVVVRTDDGLQEVIVRKFGESWLIDLTSLTPPFEEGE
jgi:hypothetical protein